MELFGSNIKKFQETETPKKILFISVTGTLKKLLIFWEMEPFSPPQQNVLYLARTFQPKLEK